MAVVVFSSAQRKWVGGVERVDIDAKRVVDLIRALGERFPELADRLDDSAVSIDGHIHNDAGYQRLAATSEVLFVAAIAGGSDARRLAP